MSDNPARASVSGKKIVFVLFPLAALLCSTVFLVGLHEKRMRLSGRPEITAAEDMAVRDLLDSIPHEWARILSVPGQGWVIYVPCNSSVGAVHIALDSASGHMDMRCEFCDTLQGGRIFKVLRFAGGDKLELDLGERGIADAEHVTDAVAQRFPNAPVKNFVLTWRLPGADSLVFVPTADAEEFETVKAEDEASGGCGTKQP